MTSTEKIFGQISAMQTLLENFPMSIFQNKGKTYNSVFDFVIDVLYACGVDTNEILSTILEQIYGVEGLAGSSIEGLFERIRFGNFEVDTQNPLMQKIEEAIKMILMGLFTSIFTCSAVPILPNKVFDLNNYTAATPTVTYLMSDAVANSLEGIVIPVSVIDIMGLLNISPTSYKGHLYYMTEGKDTYYEKIAKTKIVYYDETKTINPGETYQKLVPKYDKEILLCLNVSSEDITYTLVTQELLYQTSYIDLNIVASVLYEDGSCDLSATLLTGENSVTVTSSKPIKKIIGVLINGNEIDGDVSYDDGGETKKAHLFLCKEHSSFSQDITESIKWGTMLPFAKELKTLTATTVITETVSVQKEEISIEYSEVEKNQIPNGSEIVRKSTVPTNVDDSSPEYIVSFQGENPNTLYRTYDMNAFIWYALNRGIKGTQFGLNQMMWDSRVEASKNSVTRASSEDWNQWYNSKAYDGDEFKFQDNSQNEYLYPIIQLEKESGSKRNLLIHIPSQKYFKPRNRVRMENGEPPTDWDYNASIYKYDWDYLKNIRILNPKILLSRLVENLLGFALEVEDSFNFNFVKNIIKGKMSTAVKTIIESNDMEVEDCYNVFSNEDFDELLKDMLLQRYSATYTKNGEARTFDVDSYVNQIDKVNEASTREGTVTQLTKLVTDITVEQGTDSEVNIDFEYGFKMDGGVIKKLLYAITMPIIESLFTPQVMLLVAINFEILGVVKLEDFLGNDLSTILNFFFNKILGLVKSIILFIKDKIVEILMDLFYKYVRPLIINWLNMLLLERLEYWLTVLFDALNCLPTMMFSIGRGTVFGDIDNVEYADIVTPQNIPESKSEC